MVDDRAPGERAGRQKRRVRLARQTSRFRKGTRATARWLGSSVGWSIASISAVLLTAAALVPWHPVLAVTGRYLSRLSGVQWSVLAVGLVLGAVALAARRLHRQAPQRPAPLSPVS